MATLWVNLDHFSPEIGLFTTPEYMLEVLGCTVKTQCVSGHCHMNVEGTNLTLPSLPQLHWFLGLFIMFTFLFCTQAKLKSTSSSCTYWNLSYHFIIPTVKTFTQAINNSNLFCQEHKYPPLAFQLLGNADNKVILTVSFLASSSESIYLLPCISK